GVTGNFIGTPTLISGGSGYSMTLPEPSRLTWTGQHRMIDYLPRGFSFPAGGTIVSRAVTDCAFSNLADAIKMNAPTTSAIITGNSADLIYSAFLSLGLSGATLPPTTTIISDNFGSRFFYDVTGNDAGNPHGDFAHLFMNQTNLPFTPSNWVVQNFDRNVVTTGNSRGSTIPLLMGNCPGPGAVFEIQHCVGNLMICDYVTSGFNFDGFSNSYFYRNTNVRSTPTNPPNSGAIGMSFPSPTQAANAVGKTFL